MQAQRAAGILLHITSLPSEFGIGDLGPGAFEFVDFLERSGQRVWQLLPLGPTTHGDSPYSCYSAFAGNPLMISPRELVRQGQLPESALPLGGPRSSADGQVDFAYSHQCKSQLLEQAFDHFLQQPVCEQVDRFEAFCTLHKWWLDDFALFAALMSHFGTDGWCQWEPGLVRREPARLAYWRDRLARRVEFHQYVQFIFYSQWQNLKEYAAARDVRLFGDMPIFVAHGSSDVWSNQSLFSLEESGAPQFVAGVPPDYFSKTGQLWGNPLYRWDALEASGYRWWTRRFKAAFELFDLLRIDHFRGFESYWEVPAEAKTAISGRWAPGPGAAPFDRARRELGDLPIVAEDLGLITEEVHALRKRLGFPGMRVLQFGFDRQEDTFHRPESYPYDSVAYTGTHDNSTIVGWYRGRRRTPNKPDVLQRYLQASGRSIVPEQIHWLLISLVLDSKSNLTIVPMQDVLGLDDRARMNTPGQASGNWGWRLPADSLTAELAQRLRGITQTAGRCA